MREVAVGTAVLLCLAITAGAANFTIDNPADRINNPAGRLANPAARMVNPAAVIDNPAARLDNPDPLVPPNRPVPPSVAAPAPAPANAAPKPVVPLKRYGFTKVRLYFDAAKKAFVRDDYLEFLAVTEDALRRIEAGTLKASIKSRQKLARFKAFGYSMLEE